MKLKFLLYIPFLLGATVAAKAQTYGQWQGATQATSFDYVLSGNGTYAYGPSINSSVSSQATAGWLPAPIGTAKARISTAAGAGADITLAGSVLTLNASKTNEPNKVALYDVPNATAVTSIFFDLSFDGGTSGTAVIGFGKTSDIFTDSNPLINASAPGVFGALRFTVGNSFSNSGVRLSTFSYGTPNTEVFPKTGLINVEIYCNNTNAAKSYARGATNYSLPARSYHVYANNTPVLVSASPNLATSAELAVDQSINALLFAGTSSTLNTLKFAISNIKFGWIPQNVLPVKLISFYGEKTTSGVQLNWATASEKDNAYFEVLRASNTGEFKSIAQVTPKGSGSTTSNYQWVDKAPLRGDNYYKLKQVDLNGDSEEFGPVLVKYDLERNKLDAFVNANQQLMLAYQASTNTTGNLIVTDLNGKQLIAKKINLQKGNNQPTVDLSSVPKGLYVVKLSENQNNGVTKFIKP